MITVTRVSGATKVSDAPTYTLAIDPGPTQSAYAFIDDDCRPVDQDKCDNLALLGLLRDPDFFTNDDGTPADVAIEMVASYGMAVGAEVFETCVWIGRFDEALVGRGFPDPDLVVRMRVKLHHCRSSRATDATITQALVDRFAPGQPNRGKGTKRNPGWFYGFRADMWQAYALAVYQRDQRHGIRY